MVNVTNSIYNITDVTSGANILDFVKAVNDMSGQMFMLGMLFAGFIITYSAMSGNASPKESFMGSGFMISVISVFFFILEFIDDVKLIVILIFFGIAFAISFFTRD